MPRTRRILCATAQRILEMEAGGMTPGRIVEETGLAYNTVWLHRKSVPYQRALAATRQETLDLIAAQRAKVARESLDALASSVRRAKSKLDSEEDMSPSDLAHLTAAVTRVYMVLSGQTGAPVEVRHDIRVTTTTAPDEEVEVLDVVLGRLGMVEDVPESMDEPGVDEP